MLRVCKRSGFLIASYANGYSKASQILTRVTIDTCLVPQDDEAVVTDSYTFKRANSAQCPNRGKWKLRPAHKRTVRLTQFKNPKVSASMGLAEPFCRPNYFLVERLYQTITEPLALKPILKLKRKMRVMASTRLAESFCRPAALCSLTVIPDALSRRAG